MAKFDEDADFKAIQAELERLKQEVDALKEARGPQEEEDPEERPRGLLPGKNRAQTEAIRAAQAEALKADPGQGQQVPLGGPGSDEFPRLDELEARQERGRDARGAREFIENLPDNDVLNAQRNASSSALEEDFNDKITTPNIIIPSSTDYSAINNQLKGEKPPQVPSQPGLIKIQAADENGVGKCFEVIGNEDDHENCMVSRSYWWQPTWDSDNWTLSIGAGLNLHSAPPATGKEFPQHFWKKTVSSSTSISSITAGTHDFWVSITFTNSDKQELLVADNLCNDTDSDGDFEQISGSTDNCDASIKQYYYAKSTPTITAHKVTGGSTPADTDLVKQQYLGSITVSGGAKITAWDWRINHCFYWDYMCLSQGSHGDTSGSDEEYTVPTSH
jgi:hypothetical protein